MLYFLIGIYIACELIANITAVKIVDVGGITVPAAVFIYALTFTLIDLINEAFGKAQARKIIWTAFAANLLLAAYIQLTIKLPAAVFWPNQNAYTTTLGSTWRIIAASL
ncbi:queuosine precursor transporter, partial [Candidatus Aquicultor secundus]